MDFSPVPVSGQRLRCITANGLTFSYSRHREPVARHARRETMIVIGSSGVFEEQYTGRLRPSTCLLGTALVRPAGELHSNRFGPDGACDLAIEIDRHALERLYPWRSALCAIQSWQSTQIAALTRRIRREMELHDAASPLALESLALALVTSLYRSAHEPAGVTTNPVWLASVRDLIRDEWRHRPIRLDDLANLARVHPVHLARVYRSRFGETPAGSVRRLRIEWAADQLVASRKPMSEIALEAGFSDQSHFTRVFAAAFGTTPRKWRYAGRRN